MHAVCATFFKVPELAIDAQEAHMVADAAAQVAKHYDMLPDPKTQAWINLLMVCGAVYGPRAYVIYNRAQPASTEPVRSGETPAAPVGIEMPNITQFAPAGRA